MNDNELRWRDEILQMLYWMRGENLGTEVTSDQLNRFLQLTPDQLSNALQSLLSSCLITASDDSSRNRIFRLTESGIEEGKRRFTDEFSPYLGKESHLECSEPNCDCHDPEFSGVCGNLQKSPN